MAFKLTMVTYPYTDDRKMYDLEVKFVNNGLVCLLNNPIVFDKIDLYR